MKLKWKLTSGFSLPLLLLIIIASTVNLSLSKLLELNGWVNHTHEVIELGNDVTSSLVNMETGLRGYLITGNKDFLEPYNDGKEQFQKLIDAGRKKVSDNPDAVGKLTKVERLKQEWQNNHVSVAMRIRQDVNDGKAPATDIVTFIEKAIGKTYMDKMRAQLNDFIGAEAVLIKVRADEQQATADLTSSITTFGTIIALLLGAAASILIIRNMGQLIGGEPTYAIEVASRIADGDLEAEVETNPSDTHSLLHAMKVMRENLLNRAQSDQALVTEIATIISSANDGDLSQRLETESKTGIFKGLSEDLNTLMNSIEVFIGDVGHVFEAMSGGDLTQSISSEYRGEFNRIKTNANNSVNKLSEVLTKIQTSSRSVETSSTEVAQGSDDLSRRTESQASSLEETASSMEEITATVKQTSENATQSNVLANDAKSKAQQGGEVVQGAVIAMSEILDSSNKINDIIGVIDEIAFQTNLLALNAAVEAARAGEQGRGFAVVAGEVRTLSQRSAAAAKEIKDLIRDSVNKVESGSALVNQSGQMLTEIVQAVDNVSNMINDVNNAAKEQNSGINQINQAITQMDEMTQQNAALVEESSAASRAMSEEARNMNNMIGFFNMGHGGGAPSYASNPEPIKKYQSAPAPSPASQNKSNDGAASFAKKDDWEDF